MAISFPLPAILLLCLAGAGCGEPEPAQPDPRKLEQLVERIDAEEQASRQSDAQREEGRRTEEMLGRLDRSLPENLDDEAAEAVLTGKSD
jgi:hypothetical protein